MLIYKYEDIIRRLVNPIIKGVLSQVALEIREAWKLGDFEHLLNENNSTYQIEQEIIGCLLRIDSLLKNRMSELSDTLVQAVTSDREDPENENYLKDMALEVIEALCDGKDPVRMADLYKYAHVARTSPCENKDWIDELKYVHKSMKESGVI